MCDKPSYEELEQRCKALEKIFAKRKGSEGELLELEKRYRDLFNNISDLIGIDIFTVPGSGINCILWETARGGPLRMGQPNR
jgi:streptomycin 6-kinase